MNVRYALTVTALAFAMSSCGSKDLAQDQAKTLLNEYLDKNPMSQPLLTGMAQLGTDSEAVYFASAGGRYQKGLEADGLITIASKGKIVKPDDKSRWFNALDIQLTDKGKKFVTGTPNTTPAMSANTWPTVYENVMFCGKEVVEIKSVATNEDFARVDYTWRSAKLSPFAEHMHAADPSTKSTCDTTAIQTAQGTFERKDDVWHVATAQ